MQFLVPKEPRLLWSMFYPSSRGNDLPPSLKNGKPTYYVFWARNAIYHGLRALGISPGENILVPSFHCATAVEPILRYGAKVTFYNIRRDCSPDFGDIQAKIDDKTQVILAIHYFDFPQPIRKFQEFCKDHQLYLIEDCAHVLTGEAEGVALGSFGDISVFSWRKFLPLYDGGHLIINNPNLSIDISWEKNNLLFSLRIAKNILDQLIDGSPSKMAKVIFNLFRLPYTVTRGFLPKNRRRLQAFAVNNYDLDFDLSSVNLRMSGFSKCILRNTDIPAIVEKRRLNCNYLLKAVESLPEITPFFPHLPEGVCPWVLPVLAHGRKDFHTVLRSKGVPAVTWGGVIHPTLPLEEFPDASFLYQNLVFLPIHQSIGESEMQTMIEVLAEALLHGN